MPPRRRAAAAPAPQAVETPTSRRSTRTLKPEPSPLPDRSPTQTIDDERSPSGPSRTRGKAQTKAQNGVASRRNGSGRAGAREGRASLSRVKSETAEGSESDTQRERRLRKSVSYREIGPDELEDEGQDEDEPEGDEDGQGENDVEEEQEEAAPITPSREKVGSGRGGFSVKGAAAAAARARWAKVRRERAERGEDDDDGPSVRRRTGGGGGARKGDARSAAVESFEMDSTITIKGVDYTVGDDELILDADPKGDTKVDAEGNLLGGREYKLTTFTSPTRRSPNKVYTLTIDAARACGYTDSLAFLRRCPQLLKLACNNDERQMLIDIGRVTGNLRNRMVTMVAMRNVYKLMGARVVKNGRWVTDDYYEDKALAECAENGFTPGAVAHEDEIIANALSSLNPQGRPPNNTATQEITRQAANLTSFYTLGGPTTTFAGNGADPFSEHGHHGHGHKRARLRNAGVTEEDWMFRTAEESRKVDETLRAYREERLQELGGADMKGWVWTAEQATAQEGEAETDALLGLPKMERKRSALSQEVVPRLEAEAEDGADADADDADADGSADADTDAGDKEAQAGGDGQADGNGDISMSTKLTEASTANGHMGNSEGKVIVQTAEETRAVSAAFNWGLGSWTRGRVKAAYEPHTHMPHVPLHTQPLGATTARVSHFPILAAQADIQHKNFVMSSVTGRAARGLASVEYVLETGEGETTQTTHFQGGRRVWGKQWVQEHDRDQDRDGWQEEWDPLRMFGFAKSRPEAMERKVRDAEEWAKRERARKALPAVSA